MALTTCRFCGGQVSDRAVQCPKCGAILLENRMKVCADCGRKLSAGVTVCPECGRPAEEKKRGWLVPVLIVGIVALLVGLFAAAGTACYRQAAAAAAERQAKEAAEDYAKELFNFRRQLGDVAADAERVCALTLGVWGNAIYERDDPDTDPFTKVNGIFVEDFNDALGNLYADAAFRGTVDGIYEKRDAATKQMKKLMSPPAGCEDAYTAAKAAYDACMTLSGMALKSRGSYNSFSEEYKAADDACVRTLRELELYY